MDLIQPPAGQTLESLVLARPPVAAPSAPVFDPSKPFTPVAEPTVPVFDPAKPFTPVADTAPVAAPQFDPNAPVQKLYGIEEFAAKPAAELIADKDFMPVQFGTQHESELTPELRTKLEEVYAARETSGTSVKDKAKAFFTGIAPAVKTLAEGAKSAFKVSQKFTPAGIVAEVAKAETAQDFVNAYAKTGTEAAASVELAALGSTDLLRRSAREVGEGLGAIPGVGLLPSVSGLPVRTSKANMSESDWRTRLSDDIAAAKQVEVAGQGNGAVMDALGIDAATLEKDFGIKVDPEEIARLSVVTDPINYVPLGATVGFVGKIGGKLTRGAVAATTSAKQAAKLAEVLNTATAAASAGGAVAEKAVGTVAKSVGGAIESVGNVAEKGVRALGGTASGVGLGGLLGGNVYTALGGAAIAKAVPRLTQATGRAISGAGRILTGEAAAPAALTLAGDTLKAGAAGAIKGAAEGGVLILPFEIGARPEEEEQLLGMVGLGAAIRGGAEGVRPGARAAGRVAQNKLAETIFKTVEQSPLAESPTYGTDPLLDSNHAVNTSKLSGPEQKLVNWGRELLRGAGGEVYVLDTPAFAREAQGNKTARGYAISIGETIAPDGSAKPLFRIFLNRDAEALPHEFFHALTDLDPKRAADFRDTVQKSLTPEQLNSFEHLYNASLNNGLPEVQWKSRLSPEQVVENVAAETFSRVFLSQDLSGVSPTVQQKAALFVSSLLEKAGAPLAGVNKGKGTPGASFLGVRGSTDSVKLGQAWVKNMVERVNERGTLGEPPILATRPDTQTPIPGPLVSKKPVGAKPAPKAPVVPPAAPVNPPTPAVPAPKPVGKRNIRTPKAKQDDFAGQRAEVTNVEPARAAAEASGDANTIARVTEISDLIESGSPVVEIEHSGVKAAGTETAPSGRTARRAEQEAAYIAEGMANAPEPIREAYQKVFVPVRWEVVGGKPQLLAMSLDKVIANAHKTVKESAARGVAERIPYEITDGKLTDNAWGQFVDDLKAYADNQANGYRGDGQKLIRPTEDVGLSIPAENPAYNPRPITEERANFINLVQGLNPPLTARVGKQSSAVLPGNVKGQVLAEVNARTPEVPSVIRPEDITKQEFKNVPGRSVAETNPLRNELSAAGVPVRELIEVTERINAGDINSVRPRPELDFKAPVTDTIRGGFLPELKLATPETVRKAGDFLPESVEKVRDDIRELLKSRGMEDLSDFILQSYRTSGDEIGQYVSGSASGLRGKKIHILLNQKYLADLGAVRDTVLHEIGHVVWELTPEIDRNKWATETKTVDLSEYQASAHSPEELFAESFMDWIQDSPRAILPDSIAEMVRAEDAAHGSFLPGEAATSEVISDVLKMDSAAFNAAAKSWDGGQRNRAYDLGLSTKSPEEVQLLRDAQESASADRKKFMAARDIDNGVASALKAQFFREAYEAATDTGGAAGEIGWRQAFPDRKAPFPEVAPGGDFLPEKREWVDGALKAAQTPNSGHYVYGSTKYLAEDFAKAARLLKVGYTPEEHSKFSNGLQKRIKNLLDIGYEEGKIGYGAKYYAKNAGAGDLQGRSSTSMALLFDKQMGNEPGTSLGDFLPGDDRATTGLAFKDFFSRASKGEFGKSEVPWVPLVDITAEKPLLDTVQKHSGNFDEHIAKSIPSYRETQLKKGSAILKLAESSDEPLKVLDVGGSEGSWNKALSEQSAGKVQTLVVDPNPTMAEFFRTKSQVPGAEYSQTAWVRGFEDEGTTVPAFDTADKFDVVNESMVFQFISPERDAQVAEAKKFLKPDGLFITDEKVRTDAWAANEAKKDAEYKKVYFSKDELAAKDKVVGFQQSKSESKAVGMVDNMVPQESLESTLGANFKHVAQYWDSGNFKGYVASDSLPKLNAFLEAAGDTSTDFTTTQLPRTVEARGDFMPTGREWEAILAKRKAEAAKAQPKEAAPKTLAPATWILPDGEVKKVTTTYHEQDLATNSADYNKRFGTKFSKSSTQEDRVNALNKGFVRVRYSPENGRTAVEVGAAHWNKQKAAVLDTLLNSADKVDNLVISLLDENGVAVDTVVESIFKADDKAAAITSAVNELVPPTTARPKNIAPTDITRMRALPGPGDFLPGDVAPMLDLGLPSEEKMKQTRVKARVSKAKDAFPEAIPLEYQKDDAGKFILGEDGKPKPVVQEYQFMESPLAREAAKGLKGEAREDAYTDALAKKLVTAAKAGAKRADIQAGAKWYSTTRTRLKGLLGDDTKFFAELLGATSARTPVDTNFRFAMDAYNQFKSGGYDGIIGKYREGKKAWDTGQIQDYLEESGSENPTRGQFLDWWVVKHDLSPVQSNGKKFGMNSRAVLRVLDGSWSDEVQGPKTPNFAGNLSGETFEATVDVWAARLLHRLSNEGNSKRWRILPENETGVTDADFFLGQSAYRKAADKLGMKPDSLQAILWFLEKDYWEKKGWTRGAGAAKSDFQSLLADTERTDAGLLRRKAPQNELAFGLEAGDIKKR